jgi:hypothetical protein
LTSVSPWLRAVTLVSAAEERAPAKAAMLRQGNFDVIIVPMGMLVEVGGLADTAHHVIEFCTLVS